MVHEAHQQQEAHLWHGVWQQRAQSSQGLQLGWRVQLLRVGGRLATCLAAWWLLDTDRDRGTGQVGSSWGFKAPKL